MKIIKQVEKGSVNVRLEQHDDDTFEVMSTGVMKLPEVKLHIPSVYLALAIFDMKMKMMEKIIYAEEA